MFFDSIGKPRTKAADTATLREVAVGGVTVRIRFNRRAKRFTLRLSQPGQDPVVTVPPGVPEREIASFLARHTDWLRAALARQPQTIPVAAGAQILVDGRPVVVSPMDGLTRPRLEGSRLLIRPDRAPGPLVATWLKDRARARMVPMVHEYAARLGRQVTGVAFKDTTTRWGSCSTRSRINLSWRLAMAPPEVQTYLCAHEAAHLVEMNHSPRFWAVVAELMPSYRQPQTWLRRDGRGLHAYLFTPDETRVG